MLELLLGFVLLDDFVELELDLVELELEPDDPDWVVSVLPPRSPGCAIASTTAAPNTTTIAAIKKGMNRFRALTLRCEDWRRRDRKG